MTPYSFFKTGGVYRCELTTDIDIYVSKVTYLGAKYTKLKVLYLNRNYNNMLLFKFPEEVKICHDKQWLWSKV